MAVITVVAMVMETMAVAIMVDTPIMEETMVGTMAAIQVAMLMSCSMNTAIMVAVASA